jgi:hypothetical protein
MKRPHKQPDEDCPSVQKLKRAIRKSDPATVEGHPTFDAALVLLAAYFMGHEDRKKLAEFTGVPLDLVNEFAEPLECDDIWQPDGSTDCKWWAKKTGTTAFWCDVAVAVGQFKRLGSGDEYMIRDRVNKSASSDFPFDLAGRRLSNWTHFSLMHHQSRHA